MGWLGSGRSKQGQGIFARQRIARQVAEGLNCGRPRESRAQVQRPSGPTHLAADRVRAERFTDPRRLVGLVACLFLCAAIGLCEFGCGHNMDRRSEDPPKQSSNEDETDGDKEETAHFRERRNVAK